MHMLDGRAAADKTEVPLWETPTTSRYFQLIPRLAGWLGLHRAARRPRWLGR